MARDDSLLVVGAGALGRRVGALWLTTCPGAEVLCETRTTATHAALASAGMKVRVRESADPAPRSFVLFSVPPSGQGDYVDEARRAMRLWDGRGRMVMTSSTAVYREAAGGICSERSPLADSERAQRLRSAEQLIIDAGGAVVRLAGLYDGDRGPHRVYLRTTASPRRPDGWLNLIHYDDAASLCVAALERGEAGELLLGCDGQPITRDRLVASTAKSLRYAAEGGECRFEGTSGPLGRRCDNDWTRRRFDWAPRYASFADWLASE